MALTRLAIVVFFSVFSTAALAAPKIGASSGFIRESTGQAGLPRGRSANTSVSSSTAL